MNPNLGVVQVGDRTFVVADIPGLIEGAHEGVGWASSSCVMWSARGCWCIWWMFPNRGRDPVHDFEVILAELASFSRGDGGEADARGGFEDRRGAGSGAGGSVRRVAAERGLPFYAISSVTGQGHPGA